MPIMPQIQAINLPDLASGYHLLRLLGRGSYGEVWHAEAPGGVEVAIKIIPRLAQDHDAGDELNALQVMKRLRHPNLLSLQAFFAQPDRLLIVLELADGNKRQYLQDCQQSGRRALPLRELLGYVHEAAEALDYLHANHVQHRDIKPDNLLLIGNHVKVGDYGLARLMEHKGLHTATCLGTPAYMAPEVCQGKISRHSDQYCLALTYAELRLGKLPFAATSIGQVLEHHLHGTPDLSALGQAEQQVLLRALAKEPDQRFESCLAFVQALVAAVSKGTSRPASPVVLATTGPRPAKVLPVQETRRSVQALVSTTPEPRNLQWKSTQPTPPPASRRRQVLLGILGGVLAVAVTMLAWGLYPPLGEGPAAEHSRHFSASGRSGRPDCGRSAGYNESQRLSRIRGSIARSNPDGNPTVRCPWLSLFPRHSLETGPAESSGRAERLGQVEPPAYTGNHRRDRQGTTG
jgi:serine/threonine protein kinase